MDQHRFDGFSRSLATRTSRRRVGAGGLLGGLGAVLGVQGLRAQGTIQTCALPIYARVYLGPYLDTEYEGTLSLDIDETGAIDSGAFQTIDGQRFPLVGQADGRALDLRIDLGNGLLLTLTGAAELPFSVCQGAAAGSFGGPEMGNMGTWTTIAEGSAAPISTIAPDAATQTPTPCPDFACLEPLVPNSLTCECDCPDPLLRCGPGCCPVGADCIDPESGTCECPAGTEECGDACVPACAEGEDFDDACECVAPCLGVDCELGETLNLETCECETAILCQAGFVACGDVCADLDTDPENCGSCGHECPWMPTADDLLLPSLCVAADCCLDENMLCAGDVDCCSGACNFISGGLRVCT